MLDFLENSEIVWKIDIFKNLKFFGKIFGIFFGKI